MRPKTDVDAALRATSRAGVLEALRPRGDSLSLADINRLRQRLQSLDDRRVPLRLAIVRTYTTELLHPYLSFEALLQGFDLALYEAPYGAHLQALQPGSGLHEHQPEVTFLLLRWEDLDPRFAGPLAALPSAARHDLAGAAAGTLIAWLQRFREALPGVIVVTLLPRMAGPDLGHYEAMAEVPEPAVRFSVKQRVATHLREQLAAVHLHDLDALAEEIGRLQLFDHRLWHSAQFPFSVVGAQALVRRLMCYPVVLKRPRIKCLALDADNTLWGGIIGEDGLSGIALGPDYPGSVYVAFQQRLLALQQRGLLLALCTKNNSADVLEVLSRHPHQVLRASHFAAMRINWLPKPENLQSLADELNLGLDAFVFVDDSQHECLAVGQQLPQVTVVRVPAQKTDLPFCLDDLPQLEILSLTDEDRRRTAMYAENRRRRELADASGSLEQYLASLQMAMTVTIDDVRGTARIAQLTQKTNQFNLTTRRYTEADIRRFIDDPDCLVAAFSLRDIFGDSGVVGVALIRGLASHTAEFDTLLMSCRVIGRGAETAFVHWLLKVLAERGIGRVRASYIPTSKNMLVKDFWPQHGFAADASGGYHLDLTGWRAPAASHIRVSIGAEKGAPASSWEPPEPRTHP